MLCGMTKLSSGTRAAVARFDGPGHIGVREGASRRGPMVQRNRSWPTREHLSARAEEQHGKIGPMSQGVLIDVAGLKGVNSMKKGEVITPKDIEDAIKRPASGPFRREMQ